jgi:hypothetical protein
MVFSYTIGALEWQSLFNAIISSYNGHPFNTSTGRGVSVSATWGIAKDQPDGSMGAPVLAGASIRCRTIQHTRAIHNLIQE